MTQKDVETAEILPFQRPLATNPKGPEGPDWLRQLPHGARFLCQPKGYSGYVRASYGIAAITEKSILLAQQNPDNPMLSFLWVDSVKFSRHYEFIERLPDPPELPDEEAGEHSAEHYLPRPADSSADD